MLLYKESISIWTLNNLRISTCYELLFTCVCSLFEQYGFEVLILVYLFLEYEFTVVYKLSRIRNY
jgi:hypothetical protein